MPYTLPRMADHESVCPTFCSVLFWCDLFQYMDVSGFHHMDATITGVSKGSGAPVDRLADSTLPSFWVGHSPMNRSRHVLYMGVSKSQGP